MLVGLQASTGVVRWADSIPDVWIVCLGKTARKGAIKMTEQRMNSSSTPIDLLANLSATKITDYYDCRMWVFALNVLCSDE